MVRRQSEGTAAQDEVRRLAFLQALLARGLMRKDDAMRLMADLGSAPQESAFDALLASINGGIMADSLEVRTAQSLVDGSFFVGLVNKDGEDAASKVGTTYSHPEREFLKDLIKTLATGTHPERGGSMTSSDALNMGLMDFGNDEVPAYWKKLSKKEREMALRKFIEDGYLECPQQGVFSLGVRTLLELNNFIMQMDLPPDNREAFEKFL